MKHTMLSQQKCIVCENDKHNFGRRFWNFCPNNNDFYCISSSNSHFMNTSLFCWGQVDTSHFSMEFRKAVGRLPGNYHLPKWLKWRFAATFIFILSSLIYTLIGNSPLLRLKFPFSPLTSPRLCPQSISCTLSAAFSRQDPLWLAEAGGDCGRGRRNLLF